MKRHGYLLIAILLLSVLVTTSCTASNNTGGEPANSEAGSITAEDETETTVYKPDSTDNEPVIYSEKCRDYSI